MRLRLPTGYCGACLPLPDHFEPHDRGQKDAFDGVGEGISPRMFAPVKPLDSQRTSSIPNLVTRVFDAGELNRVWMSDITYLRTGEGWLYLCVVRDGHSRRVLG